MRSALKGRRHDLHCQWSGETRNYNNGQQVRVNKLSALINYKHVKLFFSLFQLFMRLPSFFEIFNTSLLNSVLAVTIVLWGRKAQMFQVQFPLYRKSNTILILPSLFLKKKHGELNICINKTIYMFRVASKYIIIMQGVCTYPRHRQHMYITILSMTLYKIFLV